MSKKRKDTGIIYVMTSVVRGLIKIGQTGSDNFEERMSRLERDGYCNVGGLQRYCAIEVTNYKEKEKLLKTIFEKSQVGQTELFALNKDVAKQLLTSLDGRMVYPEEEKEEAFDEAVEATEMSGIKNGTYICERPKKGIYGKARLNNGVWTLLKESVVRLEERSSCSGKAKERRKELKPLLDSTGKLMEDFEIGEVTPSCAGGIVLGTSSNGWQDWKDSDGEVLDIYRNLIE